MIPSNDIKSPAYTLNISARDNFFPRPDLKAIRARLTEMLEVRIDGSLYWPGELL